MKRARRLTRSPRRREPWSSFWKSSEPKTLNCAFEVLRSLIGNSLPKLGTGECRVEGKILSDERARLVLASQMPIDNRANAQVCRRMSVVAQGFLDRRYGVGV